MNKFIFALLTTLITTTALLMAPNVSHAIDDKKSMSGYGCFPQRGQDQADFFYAGGAIVNRTSSSRNVVCTIFRDKFSAGGGFEVDSVRVYYMRDATAVFNNLSCQTLVRNLITGTVSDAVVANSGLIVGNGILTISGLSYSSENDVIYLFCTLPANSRILGLRWEEDLDGINGADGTELGEGE